MDSRCTNCGAVNTLKTPQPNTRYTCGKCGHPLPPFTEGGDTSMAVGLLGGAALGAAVGGPVGAVIGAIGGALLGKSAKGVG